MNIEDENGSWVDRDTSLAHTPVNPFVQNTFRSWFPLFLRLKVTKEQRAAQTCEIHAGGYSSSFSAPGKRQAKACSESRAAWGQKGRAEYNLEPEDPDFISLVRKREKCGRKRNKKTQKSG